VNRVFADVLLVVAASRFEVSGYPMESLLIGNSFLPLYSPNVCLHRPEPWRSSPLDQVP